jgi:hypothetical protein
MVDFAMWKKALTGIQRVNKEEFAKLDIFSKWLITTRASVFIITYLSAFIAGRLQSDQIWVLINNTRNSCI